MLKRSNPADYRSIVVRYRPWQRMVLIVAVIGLLLAVGVLSAFWGGYHTNTAQQKLSLELNTLQKRFLKTQKQRDQAEQQLANAHLGADVDRRSVNDVRVVLREHQQTITELNEEISFYKGLMSPSERERGLSVRSVEWYKTNKPGHVQFKLVFQQTALKHRLLRGSVRVVLVGWVNAEDGAQVTERRYALSDLSEDVKKKDIPLRFKYFQNLEGELVLPEGFDVQKVELVARALAPKKVQIEQTVDWHLQDH